MCAPPCARSLYSMIRCPLTLKIAHNKLCMLYCRGKIADGAYRHRKKLLQVGHIILSVGDSQKCTGNATSETASKSDPTPSGIKIPASQTLVGGELNTWKGTTLCISCMVCWNILVFLSCAVTKVYTLMRNNYKTVCNDKRRRQTSHAVLYGKNDQSHRQKS